MVDKGWVEAIEIEVGDNVLLKDNSTAAVEEKMVEQLESPIILLIRIVFLFITQIVKIFIEQ